MTPRASARLAWGIATVAVAAAGAILVLALTTPHSPSLLQSSLGIDFCVGISFSLIGALIASRRPESPIGWILVLIAVPATIEGLTIEYAILAIVHDLPGAAWSAWISSWISILIFPAGLLLFLILLFPTGSIPSRGWRWLPVAAVAMTTIGVVGAMVDPSRIVLSARVPSVANPLGVRMLSIDNAILSFVIFLPGLLLLVCAVISAAQRLRRARGDERQQMRWFVFAAGTTVVLFIVAALGIGLAGSTSGAVPNVIAMLGFGIALPAACGVAILKYRLYDLDLVVKKTVVFTVLAAFITLLGAGAIALASVGTLGLNVFITAAIIALAFNPVRRFARSLADRLVYGKRATPYEVLSEFSERIAGAFSADEVLPRMAQLLGEAAGAEATTVWLLVGRELRPVASWPTVATQASLALAGDELPAFGDRESGFEIVHQAELLGALTVSMPANDPLDTTREKLARGLASQAGLVLRNVRLIEDLRASRQRLVKAQDQERRRLERNIHDGAQQQLVALAVKLNVAGSLIDRDPAQAKSIVESVMSETRDALENLRDLARGIYPPLLVDKGLPAALEAQARRAPLPIAVETAGIDRYPQEIEAAVYFCALEAMQNISKYARASRATIRVSAANGDLRFEVSDDGVGFDPADGAYGTGLQGMADRLAALGGTLTIDSAPGTGTVVDGRLPLTSGTTE